MSTSNETVLEQPPAEAVETEPQPDTGLPSGAESPNPARGGSAPQRFELGGGRYPTWSALRLLFLFRLSVVVVLAIVFSPATEDPWVTRADSPFAWRILIVYSVLVLASGLNLYAGWPKRETQVHLAVLADLIVFTLLMHAAGGVDSGLGILIAMAVAVGALMMNGRQALLFASLGALAVIAEQSFVSLTAGSPASNFTQAGLLGVLFFAVALLSHVMYRRIRDAEELAARRKVDIDDLSKLNEFIIQNMSVGVLVVDGDRHVRLMNQAARELLGGQSGGSETRLGALCPQVADWLERNVRPNAPQRGLVQLGDRELQPSRKLLGDYRAAGVLLYLRDNQELLKEAQQIKLASLGTLTASIAHNIRNPLSAISHAAQLLAESQTLTQDDRHLIDIVRRNSNRIDEIVSSVLQLSRRNQLDPRSIELVSWLGELLEELRESHGGKTDGCSLAHELEAISVEVDPRHLRQVIVNLFENASIHAGGPDGPPRIELRVGRGPAARGAWVEVCDDGPGIPDETAREMFAPFYTTKASGTGLGLYIARELCETNGVRLIYERTQPHGSCFRLEFPA